MRCLFASSNEKVRAAGTSVSLFDLFSVEASDKATAGFDAGTRGFLEVAFVVLSDSDAFRLVLIDFVRVKFAERAAERVTGI
jgi:hypothetical protein